MLTDTKKIGINYQPASSSPSNKSSQPLCSNLTLTLSISATASTTVSRQSLQLSLIPPQDFSFSAPDQIVVRRATWRGSGTHVDSSGKRISGRTACRCDIASFHVNEAPDAIRRLGIDDSADMGVGGRDVVGEGNAPVSDRVRLEISTGFVRDPDVEASEGWADFTTSRASRAWICAAAASRTSTKLGQTGRGDEREVIRECKRIFVLRSPVDRIAWPGAKGPIRSVGRTLGEA